MSAAAAPAKLVTPQVTARIPALDGVRGVASLMVVYLHYIVLTVPAEAGTPLAVLVTVGKFGSTGVDLFFVLSGFLLAGILLDFKESEHYFRTFYVRRIARILPLYWCLLLLLLGVAFFTEAGKGLTDRSIPLWSYAVFVQNYYMGMAGTFGMVWLAVTWSLAVEEQFYVVLPLAIRCVGRRRLAIGALLLFFAAPVLRLALLYWGKVPALSVAVWSICRADALAAGVLAAVLFRSPRVCSWILTLPIIMPALVLGCLAISVGVFVLNRTNPVGTYVIMHPLTDASYALAVLTIAVLKDSWLARLMRNRTLMHSGTLCYATYLLHMIVIYGLFSAVLGTTPHINSGYTAFLVLVSAVMTFALAQLSWVCLEKPFIRLGQRFQY